MANFIHTADTHLGYRQYQRPEREQDYLDVFIETVDAAINHKSDALIHAGDLFHDSRPSTDTLRSTLEQLRRLRDNDIEFLGVVGNHEGTQTHQWIDIFSELDLAHHLSKSPLIINDTAIYGIDHIPEAQQGTLEYSFEPHSASHALLVAHGLFSPISPFGTWDISTILDQSPIHFDAVLLGDDHDSRIMDRNDTIVTYAGSPERTATDQTKDRSFNRITTDESNTKGVRLEQQSVDARPHRLIELELEEGDGFDRIKQEITDASITNAVVGIILTGEGDTVPPAQIEEFGKNHGAFAVRVSDRRVLDVAGVDIDVSFTDPDDVIEHHLREMNLSSAAHTIEQQVRDPAAIPKTNLTAKVESAITDRLESNLVDLLPKEKDEQTTESTEPTDADPSTSPEAESSTITESDSSPSEDQPDQPQQHQLSLDDLV